MAGAGGDLKAILDSACSKTVVGTAWLQKYLDYVKDSGYDVSFKFGAASKIYESTYAAVILVPLFNHLVAVKASVIHGDIPLLMSKPALSCLGLVLDLGNNIATFRKLHGGEVELCETASGHPAIVVDHSKLAKPDTSVFPDKWEPHGVVIVGPREVYMTACSGGNQGDDHVYPGDDSTIPKIFYDKKIDGAVRDMLTHDVLNEDLFATWWADTELTSDFWIELPHKLIRVHITPRRKFFDPRKWKTSQTHLRDQLLRQLGSVRETWGVGCLSRRMLSIVTEQWTDKETGEYPTLWVGRSVFIRSQAVPPALPACHAAGMEDDEGAAHRGTPAPRTGSQREVDVPRVEDRDHRGPGVRSEEQGPGRSEGAVRHEPRRAEGGGREDGDRGAQQGHERESHAEDQRGSRAVGHGDDNREVSGNDLCADP